jgi:hypothetical protein
MFRISLVILEASGTSPLRARDKTSQRGRGFWHCLFCWRAPVGSRARPPVEPNDLNMRPVGGWDGRQVREDDRRLRELLPEVQVAGRT